MIERGEWSRLDGLLDAILELTPAERLPWLEAQCARDPGLRSPLLTLLQAAEAHEGPLAPGGAMQGPVWDEVARELDQGADSGVPARGARLGPYQVLGELGAGGMGSVFRARDTLLDREVALKALAPAFAGDAARLRRFEREARLLAGLNHPNIAVLHEVLEVEGTRYLVLELVEGETLLERLQRGPLRIDEAITICLQVAEALEEAHRRGVVHRDLKPSNVMLSRAGRVKVLDFGLAKSIDEPRDGGRTETLGALTTTGTGAILGTAPYMSPEQARGEEVDERCDVWAFGCLLYEMVAGKRAFDGRTGSDVLAAVLRDEPHWAALPRDTPPALRRCLERCLRKDRKQRLQAIGDARIELSELAGEPAAARPRRSPRGLAAGLVAGLVLGAALASAFLQMRRPASPRPVPARFVVEPDPGVALAPDYAAPFALSPDGATLVLIGVEGGTSRLYARPLDRLESQLLPGTEDARQPFFSPDGRWVAFFADHQLKKVPLDGGAPVALAEVGGNPRGASWTRDGDIVLAPSQTSGLYRISDAGGPLRPLTALDAAAEERSHRWPQVLPDGRSVLFTVQGEANDFDEASLQLVSLASGERRLVLEGAGQGRFVESGHLLYVRGGRLYATPFDPRAGRPAAPGEMVIDGVAYDVRNGGTQLALGPDGTLVYVPGRPEPVARRFFWIDASGRRSPLEVAPRAYRDPRISPDGRRVAVRVGSGREAEVWLLDLESGTLSQLTFGLSAANPIWRPDGRGVTVAAGAPGRWRLVTVPVDGGAPEILHEGPRRVYPDDWSSDGRSLVFQQRGPESGWGLWLLAAGAAPSPLVDTPHNEVSGRLSPDGRWLAYDSDELDAVYGIYVQPLGRPGVKVKVSSDAGVHAVWGGRGELFYFLTLRNRLRRVPYRVEGDRFVALGDELAFGSEPEAEAGMLPPYFGGFDYDPKGRRFLALEPDSRIPEPSRRIVVTLDWLRQLRSRVPPPS